MTTQISVIIRSMGRPCLAEAIESAVSQKGVSGLEIVVVDAKGALHPPLPSVRPGVELRLVSAGKRLERSAAANMGLLEAQGERLIFLDDDDLFLEGHLAGLSKSLDRSPEAPASYSGVRVVDAAGREIDVYNAPYDPIELLGHNVFPIHAVLFRRDMTQDCRFDEALELYEDWDFWLQVTGKGPFVHHDAVTAIYRVAMGQSGLAIESNVALRQQGRAAIYQKWRDRWSGQDLSAYIDRCQLRLAERVTLLKSQREMQDHVAELEKALQNAHGALDETRRHALRVEGARDQIERVYLELNQAHIELQKHYVAMTTEREGLEVRNAELTAEREGLEARNAELTVECRELQSQNAELTAEREGLEARTVTLTIERDRLQQERNQLERDRDFYQQVLQGVEHSTSWRITGPLRQALIFVNALRHSEDRAWSLLRQSFHRLPLSEGLKRQVQDWLYARYTQHFSHLPSYHFRVHGITHSIRQAQIGAATPYPLVPLDELLPSKANPSEEAHLPANLQVDVIIPIYDGVDETRRCLETVLAASNSVDYRLILINDASPNPEIPRLLESLPTSDRLLVLHNAKNLGFTGTVNRGMSLSKRNDVVLLNSDTEVPDDWLGRLVSQAYRSPRIGTVTPFSNNATICSYPDLPGGPLPEGETVQSLDEIMRAVNAGRQADLPTAIGFCMYIKRKCLREVGEFDEKAFGRGYGEENDFCQRALRRGWRHVLAADVFVYHAGEVSFGADSSPGKQRAMTILRERYPDYEAEVAEYVRNDPPRPWRLAATAGRWRQQHRPVVLMITHGLGGGVDKHIGELSRTLIDTGARVLLLRSQPGRHNLVTLEALDPFDAFAVCLSVDNPDQFADAIAAFGISLVHIHHIMHWPVDLQALVGRLGRPFLFTVHDYYAVCPRVNFMGPAHPIYCGEPDDARACLDCLTLAPRTDTPDIIHWRIRHAWLFQDASAVICPTHDAAAHIQRYYPGVETQLQVVSHESMSGKKGSNVYPVMTDKPLKVMILGVVARHKGLEMLFELARMAQKQSLAIQFVVIGYCAESIPSSLNQIITQTGPYDDQDLHRLILEAEPHLVWFSARWPETWSYTLTAALNAGIPILAPRLGTFVERLSDQFHAWFYDVHDSSQDLLSWLDDYRNSRLQGDWPHSDNLLKSIPRGGKPVSWYKSGYIKLAKTAKSFHPFDIRRRDTAGAVVIPEPLMGEHPSPCGYIRLLLPLASALQSAAMRYASPAAAKYYRAGAFITQRLAFPDHGAAEEFLGHCDRLGSRIVYDLDDDILSLDESHDEAESYRETKQAVAAMIEKAHIVSVSTPELADRIRPMNASIRILPNQLDARVWRLLEPPPQGSSPIRLLYMGTRTHRQDWQMIESALERLVRRNRDNLEVHIVGIDEPGLLPAWVRIHEPPPGIAAVYSAFVRWLQSLGSFDLGVAPLKANRFSLAKSGIKYMDYTAMGAVTVASALPAYAEVIRHNENGLLVRDSVDDWEKAIDALIDAPQRRLDLWRQARNDWQRLHCFSTEKDHSLLACIQSETVAPAKKHPNARGKKSRLDPGKSEQSSSLMPADRPVTNG